MKTERKYKILIVDDSKDFVQAFQMQLEDVLKNNLDKIDVVYSGFDAVNMVKQTLYDYVFLDIRMPGLDGIETTRYLHLVNPRLKIIAVSFHDKFTYLHKIISAGARNYLLKDEISEEKLKFIFKEFNN